MALLLGVWAFLVAETVKERAIIAIAPVLAFAVRVVIPTRAGRVISLVGLMVYGIGCIIYLRLNGMGIR